MGEERGVWTPYPRGSTPSTPAQFLTRYPHPLLFQNFFPGTPAPKSDFLPPPPPIFRQKPPPPPPYRTPRHHQILGFLILIIRLFKAYVWRICCVTRYPVSMTMCINWLRPNDAYRASQSKSKIGSNNGLSPIPAPSHYLTQCWHIVKCTVISSRRPVFSMMAPTTRAGSHFTNDFSMETSHISHSSLIQVVRKWSLWGFARGTTAVQNFVEQWCPTMKLY